MDQLSELDLNFIDDLGVKIDDLVEEHDISWIDAAILYAEKNNIEIETIALAIQKNALLKSHIQEEAEAMHFLPRITRLDV